MKIGQNVIVEFHPEKDGRTINNDLRRAPGIITRVWPNGMLNVMVLPDTGKPYMETSVQHLKEGDVFDFPIAVYETDSIYAESGALSGG